MNTAATALADYMSDLSEQAYCAGWMQDLEFNLWRAVIEGPFCYGFLALASEHVQRLRILSQACGGWIVYRDGVGEEFVLLSEWQSLYLAHYAA